MQGHYGCVWFSFGNGPWENANFFGLKGLGKCKLHLVKNSLQSYFSVNNVWQFLFFFIKSFWMKNIKLLADSSEGKGSFGTMRGKTKELKNL